jgi:hypothetical protein
MPAFPVTLDSIGQTAEAPGLYGPFAVGTALYVINTTEDNILGPLLLALKSTDNGDTWAEVDPGNRPIPSGTQYTCCQSSLDPTQIYVIYIDPNTGMVTVQLFNAGSDTWGAILGAAFLGGFNTAVYRPADNSIVVLSNGFDATPNGQHNIVSFAVFDILAGTFGAPADLGFVDYSDPTLWNQKACGAVLRSDGAISVFMQQATQRTINGVQVLDFTPGSSSPWQVPFDCPMIDLVETYGAGGGGGGGGGADNGGGGGGGYRSAPNVPVTPLANIPFVVGAGALQNADGADSSFNAGLLAEGGKKGVVTAGGVGGAGDHAGGKGGDGLGTAGGGGGGCGGPTAVGSPGVDSDGTHGGAGGVGGGGQAGAGGVGGQVLLGIRFNGGPGSPVGAGGGGASSDGGLNIGTGGTGADGALRITYTPFTNSHPSRMWQQTIKADNSLGALTEITEGTFPIDGGGEAGLVPFDCKAGDGFVAIVFAWVTATGLTQMLVGKADNADVLAFTFQAVDIGASAGIDPEPALCIRPSGALHLCYISAADLVNVNYKLRRDNGTGFGTAIPIGTFADAGCRLQTAFLFGFTMGAFGTPTQAFAGFGAEGTAFIQFTALIPGIAGNLILVKLIPAASGPAASAVVTNLGLNLFQIDVTFNTAGGFTGTDFAADLNADPAVSAIVTVSGDAGPLGGVSGISRLTGGRTGQNVNTSYFFAQQNCEVGIMLGVGLKIRDWSGKAYMNDYVPAELIFGFDNSQTPGFPYPEIYIPKNQAVYLDVVALGPVNGLLTLTFKGQKVYGQ